MSTKSIPSMHDLLEANGRMNNFRRLAGKSRRPSRSARCYSDSDVYKWTEAVGFALQSGDRPELRATTEKMIDEVVAVQEPSGYLNTYYVGRSQAAADAHRRRRPPATNSTTSDTCCRERSPTTAATGDRKLLDAGIRFVNDFLMPNYGPAPKEADRLRTSGNRDGADRTLPHHRRQAATRSGRLHPAGRRAHEVAGAPNHLHVQRNSVYRAHQAGRPCGARHVRLLRRDRLLHGNRRPRVLEDAEHALE